MGRGESERRNTPSLPPSCSLLVYPGSSARVGGGGRTILHPHAVIAEELGDAAALLHLQCLACCLQLAHIPPCIADSAEIRQPSVPTHVVGTQPFL